MVLLGASCCSSTPTSSSRSTSAAEPPPLPAEQRVAARAAGRRPAGRAWPRERSSAASPRAPRRATASTRTAVLDARAHRQVAEDVVEPHVEGAGRGGDAEVGPQPGHASTSASSRARSTRASCAAAIAARGVDPVVLDRRRDQAPAEPGVVGRPGVGRAQLAAGRRRARSRPDAGLLRLGQLGRLGPHRRQLVEHRLQPGDRRPEARRAMACASAAASRRAGGVAELRQPLLDRPPAGLQRTAAGPARPASAKRAATSSARSRSGCRCACPARRPAPR